MGNKYAILIDTADIYLKIKGDNLLKAESNNLGRPTLKVGK